MAEQELDEVISNVELKSRIALFLQGGSRLGSSGKYEEYVLPPKITMSFGLIMSAVLVGNLLAALIVALVYVALR